MRRLLLGLPVLLLLACTKQESGGLREVDVETAASWLAAKTARAVDANTEEFRAQNGTVPGAVLLTNYLDWEPPEVLGPDKGQRLVFYCSNRL